MICPPNVYMPLGDLAELRMDRLFPEDIRQLLDELGAHPDQGVLTNLNALRSKLSDAFKILLSTVGPNQYYLHSVAKHACRSCDTCLRPMCRLHMAKCKRCKKQCCVGCIVYSSQDTHYCSICRERGASVN